MIERHNKSVKASNYCDDSGGRFLLLTTISL